MERFYEYMLERAMESRFDNKKVWVKDKRAKGGGYWRQLSGKPGVKAAALGAGGLALAAGGLYGASKTKLGKKVRASLSNAKNERKIEKEFRKLEKSSGSKKGGKPEKPKSGGSSSNSSAGSTAAATAQKNAPAPQKPKPVSPNDPSIDAELEAMKRSMGKSGGGSKSSGSQSKKGKSYNGVSDPWDDDSGSSARDIPFSRNKSSGESKKKVYEDLPDPWDDKKDAADKVWVKDRRVKGGGYWRQISGRKGVRNAALAAGGLALAAGGLYGASKTKLGKQIRAAASNVKNERKIEKQFRKLEKESGVKKASRSQREGDPKDKAKTAQQKAVQQQKPLPQPKPVSPNDPSIDAELEEMRKGMKKDSLYRRYVSYSSRSRH